MKKIKSICFLLLLFLQFNFVSCDGTDLRNHKKKMRIFALSISVPQFENINLHMCSGGYGDIISFNKNWVKTTDYKYDNTCFLEKTITKNTKYISDTIYSFTKISEAQKINVFEKMFYEAKLFSSNKKVKVDPCCIILIDNFLANKFLYSDTFYINENYLCRYKNKVVKLHLKAFLPFVNFLPNSIRNNWINK